MPILTPFAHELAPGGRLRVAINLGNPVLAQRVPGSAGLQGVSVELARELAGRLRLPIDFLTYDGAGKVVDAVGKGAWDLAFLAIDPVRARVLLIVDLAATTAELLAHPSPRVPVPLAAAARAPELRDALTVDGASVDAALTGFVARLDHRPALPAPEPPRRVEQVVTTALAADPPPAPDVASAGIRMAAVLASLYRLADAPAGQTPTATGTLE